MLQKTKHEKTLFIEKNKLARLDMYLNAKPNEYPELNDRHEHSLFDEEVTFETPNGIIRMAIMVLPPIDEESTAWAQAVLYNKQGGEITYSEAEYKLSRKWELTDYDNTYIVNIQAKEQEVNNKTTVNLKELANWLFQRINENKENLRVNGYETDYIEGYHDAMKEVLDYLKIDNDEKFYN